MPVGRLDLATHRFDAVYAPGVLRTTRAIGFDFGGAAPASATTNRLAVLPVVATRFCWAQRLGLIAFLFCIVKGLAWIAVLVGSWVADVAS